MNPGGAIEETGKVATSIVETMKNQPLILALVIFNVLFIVAVYYGTHDLREHQASMTKMLLDNQTKLQEMLGRCVVPDK